MSAGERHDPFPMAANDANAVITFPLVDKFMRRATDINVSDWDIPLVSGYSADGAVIYLDRDLASWPFRGKEWPVSPSLVLHARVEKAVTDALAAAEERDLERLLMLLRMEKRDDQTFAHAHSVALAAEAYAVKMQFGLDGLEAYSTFIKTQAKRADDARIRRVPPDLDLTAYADEPLRKIVEAKMAS